MNYDKKEFTKEEFLELPVYEIKQDAPKDKTPFLLGYQPKSADDQNPITGQVIQKERLMQLIEEVSKLSEEDKARSKNGGKLRLQYTIRHKDGNISDQGGFIDLDKLVESMTSVTTKIMDALNETPVEKKELSTGTIVLGEVPDNLTFTG